MVGEYGEVYVLDWGLAVDFREHPDGEERARHRSTLDGNPCGTPCYMAPELAEGSGENVGPWTDVFLLGAILHEILTCRPLYDAGSIWSTIYAACRCAVPEVPDDVDCEL